MLQQRHENCDDPRAPMTMSKRKCSPRHRQTLERILEEPPDFGDDSIGGGADEKGVAASNALRPLSFFAQDEQRSAYRCRFLLDPAGVAKHQRGVTHSLDQLAMAARRDQRDSPS